MALPVRVAGLAAAAVALVPAAALLLGADFRAGLDHPLSGADHLLAMVTVGVWAAQFGGRALWGAPLGFMAAMAVGGLAGLFGLDLPAVEQGIAASLVVLGLAVAAAARPPLWLGMAVVGALAVFHGHAHGAEIPEGVSPAVYALGFLTATAILHLSGVALAHVSDRLLPRRGPGAVRVAGAGVALSGVLLLSVF